MTTLDVSTIHNMISQLDDITGNGPWRALLQLLYSTGVADTLQIQNSLLLTRDQVRRLIDQVQACSAGLPHILQTLSQSTQRAGVRGRTPTIYRLGESGATLLRELGQKDAHECLLKSETEIQHAVLILDIRLAAIKAGYPVITDRNLQYGDGKCLRPDNRVTLPENEILLFETEQSAQASLTRRITESLTNKVEFFKSKPGAKVNPIVRMVLNTARGKDMDRTVKTWQQVANVVAQGQLLPFRLLAIPHSEFIANPDWGLEPDPDRWQELTPVMESTKSMVTGQSGSLSPAPQHLLQQSAQDDRLVLIALWQQFLENNQHSTQATPRPSPQFFENMNLIYSASFNPNGDAVSRSAMPWASIYLLKQYLQMHPGLKELMRQSITRGVSSLRWNTNIILHRMQVVMERFLQYHGWRSGGSLCVMATAYDFDNNESASFGTNVKIKDRELLLQPDQTVMPSEDEIQHAESALAWVLWALFAYADRLDLPTCGFW